MLHLFLTPSPLLAAGEVLVGISLPMFVAALIAAYGDRIRLSGGRWARTDLRCNSSIAPIALAPSSARAVTSQVEGAIVGSTYVRVNNFQSSRPDEVHSAAETATRRAAVACQP